ncbi:MAG: S8 family serine peptidase, partial [Pseudomonadota bacterium]|nr:S8 family serine peptidase [Pseudomonadota bacterium]
QLTETVTTPGPGTYIVGVRGFRGTSAYLLSAGTTTTSSAFDREVTPVGAEFVTGELLVKYKSFIGLQAQAAKHNLTPVRHVWNEAYLMKLPITNRVAAAQNGGSEKVNAPGHEENEAIGATWDALRKLRKDPAVDYAEPNYIRRATAVPTDPFYRYQWHYPAIKLPEAWDIATTRGAGTIVAVIDTGVLSGHTDLQGQLVPGYDFISNSTNGADGDGIDNNAEDPGDGTRPGESSYHGTHVAGTVAAATDNSVGGAGIAWNGKVMPLRVLGRSGGTDADIIEAMKFAARLPNASTTVPAAKADVINMSLGGAGPSATTQAVITDVRNAGVIIVAAAGNENTSNPSYPAAYDGVISVSAVGFDLKRAPYSNFGNTIDLAAPGGDTSVDLNGDTFADGVLSTLKNDSSPCPACFNYVFYQGTSMAAPHMAGVVALMRGVNPALTPSQVDQLIDGTLPQRITTDLGQPGRDNLFGHGLIDANKAVSAARELGGAPPPTGSVLTVSVANLNFDSFLNKLTISVSNGGINTLTITSVTVNQPWLTVSPTSGVAPLRLDVAVNRAGLADGTYTATITINSDATSAPASKSVDVTLRVSSTAATGNVGDVFVLLLNPNTGNSVAQDVTNAVEGYRYGFKGVAPGVYDLYAGTDRDNNDFICDIEDACGTLGRLLTISGSGQLTGEDFPVNNSQNQPQMLRKKSDPMPPMKKLR